MGNPMSSVQRAAQSLLSESETLVREFDEQAADLAYLQNQVKYHQQFIVRQFQIIDTTTLKGEIQVPKAAWNNFVRVWNDGNGGVVKAKPVLHEYWSIVNVPAIQKAAKPGTGPAPGGERDAAVVQVREVATWAEKLYEELERKHGPSHAGVKKLVADIDTVLRQLTDAPVRDRLKQAKATWAEFMNRYHAPNPPLIQLTELSQAFFEQIRTAYVKFHT